MIQYQGFWSSVAFLLSLPTNRVQKPGSGVYMQQYPKVDAKVVAKVVAKVFPCVVHSHISDVIQLQHVRMDLISWHLE